MGWPVNCKVQYLFLNKFYTWPSGVDRLCGDSCALGEEVQPGAQLPCSSSYNFINLQGILGKHS